MSWSKLSHKHYTAIETCDLRLETWPSRGPSERNGCCKVPVKCCKVSVKCCKVPAPAVEMLLNIPLPECRNSSLYWGGGGIFTILKCVGAQQSDIRLRCFCTRGIRQPGESACSKNGCSRRSAEVSRCFVSRVNMQPRKSFSTGDTCAVRTKSSQRLAAALAAVSDFQT